MTPPGGEYFSPQPSVTISLGSPRYFEKDPSLLTAILRGATFDDLLIPHLRNFSELLHSADTGAAPPDPPPPPPDPWECLECFFENKPLAPSCHLCGCPRVCPEDPPAAWTCVDCKMINPMERDVCRSCSTTKYGLNVDREFSIQRIVSEFVDSHSHQDSTSHSHEDSLLDQSLRSASSVQSPKTDRPAPPTWTCPLCYHDNACGPDDVCRGCGEHHLQGWDCPKCGFLNERHVFNCLSCNKLRPRSSRKNTFVHFPVDPVTVRVEPPLSPAAPS
eukprot:TRINITY_DN12705_c0_g1_i1.p1 TRINITY_DN12705_c0_g1~~TRINITY_DN12705_c0_g1_i1.p1  ORF type:complete len:296 (-),score=60.47 TRINITY_DN12705_c0_g1_i1:517-1341(-)